MHGYFLPHSYSAVVGGGGGGDNDGGDGDSVTLLSFYLLENLHLSQIVSGITLSQGKEINPIP